MEIQPGPIRQLGVRIVYQLKFLGIEMQIENLAAAIQIETVINIDRVHVC
jgi:hypothetical protein